MESKENFEVHEFLNDFMIQNKRIKPRAFNIFHKCQLKCFKDTKADEGQMFYCVETCKRSTWAVTRT